MFSGIWYLTRNSLKILSLIEGRNSAGRIKGLLSSGPTEAPSQDSSPSSSLSSSPSSLSWSSHRHPNFPFFLLQLLLPHSPRRNPHPCRRGTGLTSLSLTKVRNPQTHHLNRRPHRSPLLRGLTTPHSSRYLTSDYLQVIQVMDPILVPKLTSSLKNYSTTSKKCKEIETYC